MAKTTDAALAHYFSAMIGVLEKQHPTIHSQIEDALQSDPPSLERLIEFLVMVKRIQGKEHSKRDLENEARAYLGLKQVP